MVAGEENSSLKADVADRLSQVVPPKNITAATELASAGDLVVPHLAFRKMKANESAASVRALALIGSEQAHAALKDYSGDTRSTVVEILRTSFKLAQDPAGYGKAVFAEFSHIRLTGGKVSDISWIEDCTFLRSLDLSNTQVSDVSSIRREGLTIHGVD